MATGVYSVPGAYNVYVANTEATGNLVVQYSRNPKDFKVVKWCPTVPVKKPRGLYMRFKTDMADKILSSAVYDSRWAYNTIAVENPNLVESFRMEDYRCERHQETAPMDNTMIAEAAFDVKAGEQSILASRAMTQRTVEAITLATTTGNWASNHYSAAASISGNTGRWDQSTTARQDIKRSLNYAANQIEIDTLGNVTPDKLQLVLSPAAAARIAECQEITDYVKGSPDAWPLLNGTAANRGERGMPSRLYGFDVVIENATKSTNAKGATVSRDYALGIGYAYLTTKPNEETNMFTQRSFQTMGMFVYDQEEMLVEELADVNNKRTLSRVVDTRVAVMINSASGFLFTSIAA